MSGLGDQAGISLTEILIAALVVGVAAIGLALMFSTGNTYVLATGDDRIALGLAEQKIEELRSQANASLGNPTNQVCPAALCYNETNETSPAQWDTNLALPTRKFTRTTCVQHVLDTDITTPAYAAACAPYVEEINAPIYTSCSTPSATCVATSTKRITVIVTPNQPQANPVSLQGWVP